MGCVLSAIARAWSAVVAASVLALLAGCGEVRENQLGEQRCLSFEDAVLPVLEARCGSCHTGAAPAAGYSVGTHVLAQSRRDDGQPRLLPGSEQSLFFEAVKGDMVDHPALPAAEQALLRDWAVRCRAGPRDLAVHPRGWASPADAQDFHGAVLRSEGYVLDGCRDCHGEDLHGGEAKVSCDSCHQGGVLACSVCHGDATSPAPPKSLSGARSTQALGVGAHRTHLSGTATSHPVSCQTCHAVPAEAEADGHYRKSGQPDVDRAELLQLPSAPGRTASWDRTAATCANTRCHAPRPGDSQATRQAPRWTRVGEGEAACGTCHGLPPEGHADNRCQGCHYRAYSHGTLDASLHVNGVVEVGDGTGSCSGCHGDATSAAPPRDLLGRTSEAVVTVGAHRAHLEARHQLRGPIACSECHQVPAEVTSPGHLDTTAPAEVFPLLPGVGTLARADGAQPTYDAATGTCSNVYCHGAGTKLGRDTDPDRILTPSWTGGPSQAGCGACHGAPPRDGMHTPWINITYCVQCHSTTVLPTGAIKVTVDPVTGELSSTHMDGVVQIGAP